MTLEDYIKIGEMISEVRREKDQEIYRLQKENMFLTNKLQKLENQIKEIVKEF